MSAPGAARRGSMPTCSIKAAATLPELMTARKKLLLGAAVVLLAARSPAAPCSRSRAHRRTSRTPNVEFDAEPTATAGAGRDPRGAQEDAKKADPLRNFVWADYGYSKDRAQVPARLQARCGRRSGASGRTPGRSLLEFPPVMAEGKLFLLKNNGALHAIDKRTGKALWKRKLGVLAAASPAYGNGRVFVPLLSRGKSKRRARSIALDAKTGKILWKRLLPVALGVLAGVRRRPHLLRLRERHRLLDPRAATARCAGRSRPAGAVKAGARAGQRQALLRRLRRARLRDPPGRRRPGAGRPGPRARKFGLRSGQFYSTPAVAYGRVYIGNTDGNDVLVRVGQRQARVDQGHRLLRLLLARRRAGAGHEADGLLRLLRRQVLRASTRAPARCAGRATSAARSPAARRVVGDIVYFSNYAKKDTTGLGVAHRQDGLQAWAAAPSTPSSPTGGRSS